MAEKWVDGTNVVITVCDMTGRIIYMNDQSARQFAKYGGLELIGRSLFDCHPEPACKKLRELLITPKRNIYTIIKNGKKKMIVQSPWYKEEIFGGLVELSFELPDDIPHFDRS